MRARVACGGLLGVSLLLVSAGERRAAACGGEFVPPSVDEAVTTDHRMILSVSPQSTTLWDEIQFSGSPSSFAWVLPIKGTATVGLSADSLFGALDALTAPTVQQPALDCPGSLGGPGAGGGECAGGQCGTPNNNGGGGVTVLSSSVVGPFETVQLSSSSPGALTSWLTGHGFAIPSAAASVIADYVKGGFNFLAMKLAPGQGVSTMRPVRVTTAGASPVLPLRMVAIGTGATTGITLWVVGDGRYEPQNFPFFTLTDKQIVWDWTTSTSNYETLRTTQEASLGGKGWQIESSLELAQSTVIGVTMGPTFTPDGGLETVSKEYLPLDGGALDGGSASSSEAGSQVAFDDDLSTLFAGIAGPNARITRMRSDIAHAALTVDLTLQASSDQTELSNVYVPASTTGTPPPCPGFGGGPSGSGAGSTSRSSAASSAGATASGTGIGTPSVPLGTGSQAIASPAGGGCVASGAGDETWAPWGALMGLAGFGAVRARRRRNV